MKISTHAPRVRRDEATDRTLGEMEDFYSRASCEARHYIRRDRDDVTGISTHAPRVRRDGNGPD